MLKIKMLILWPWWKIKAKRAKTMLKKSIKNENRYPEQFKYDYVLKRAGKVIKALNIKLIVKGFENIPSKGSAIIAPNHASSIDPAIIIVALKKQSEEKDIRNRMVSFLAKEELRKDKNFSNYANLLKTFYLDRKNPRDALKLMNKIGPYIKEENKLFAIFPSGTRNKEGKVGQFKAGAFRIAKKDYLPIIPVTINNTLSATDLSRRGKLIVEVIFHHQIKPISLISQPTSSIARRVQKKVESAWKKPEGKRSKTEEIV